MQINPRTLKYVKTVAEEKSFSKAAEKLFISQPSLSQHIQRAEQETGVKFFNRNTIPLTLTYAGECMVRAANHFDLLERQLNQELTEILGGIGGRLIVGASSTRGALIIPKLFSRLKKDYPRLELVLKEGSNAELLAMTKAREIDLAFVGYSQEELAAVPILKDHIVLAVPQNHPAGYCRHSGGEADIRAFKNEPFIFLKSGQAIRNLSEKIFSDYGFVPNIAYETRNYNTALQMCGAGLGCTFSTNLGGKEAPDVKFLEIKTPEGGHYSYPLILVYPKDAYISHAMDQLILHAVKIGQEITVEYPDTDR